MTNLQIIVLCILTMSCSSTSDKIQNLQYSKDHRTGLCFASRNLHINTAVMANVPCTPEVEKLIQAEGSVNTN